MHVCLLCCNNRFTGTELALYFVKKMGFSDMKCCSKQKNGSAIWKDKN